MLWFKAFFSLGAVLYEALTGQRAFEGKSQLSVASAVLEKEPTPISAIKPLTPHHLDHIIRRALAKDPEDRWQSARDLALELKSISSVDPSSSQSGVVRPVARRRSSRELLASCRRHRPARTSRRLSQSATIRVAFTPEQ